MPSINPKQRYAPFLKWMQSSLTKTLLSSLEPDSGKLADTINEAEKALLAHTSTEPDLAEKAKQALDKISTEIDTLNVYLDDSSLNSYQAYLNYGKSIVGHTKVCVDDDIDVLSIFGNEYLTSTYYAELLPLTNEGGEPIAEHDINELLAQNGYDKIFNAAAERVNLSTRLATEYVTDDEYEEAKEKVKEVNSVLSDAVVNTHKILSDAHKDDNRFKPVTDALDEVRRILHDQNAAINRGWEVQRIDDYTMMSEIHDRVTNEISAVRTEVYEDGISSLKPIMRRCDTIEFENISEAEFTSRRHFERVYQSVCADIDSIVRESQNENVNIDLRVLKNSEMYFKLDPKLDEEALKKASSEHTQAKQFIKGRETGDKMEGSNTFQNAPDKELLKGADIHVRDAFRKSIFSDMAEREDDAKDIYSTLIDRRNRALERVNRLKGDKENKEVQISRVKDAIDKSHVDIVVEDILRPTIDRALRAKKYIDKFKSPELMQNEKFAKLNAAVERICSWENKPILTAKTRMIMSDPMWSELQKEMISPYTNLPDAYKDVSYNEIKDALTELKRAAVDFKKNGPKIKEKFTSAYTGDAKNANEAVKTAYNAAIKGLKLLSEHTVGTVIANNPNQKLYEVMDIAYGNNDYEKEILENRCEKIDEFRAAVFNFSADYTHAAINLIDDNNERKKVSDPDNDKRSDSYKNLISSIKLLENMRQSGDLGQFTPEEIVAAYDYAIKAAQTYVDTHTGLKGMFKAGKQAGKDRIKNARTIIKELKAAKFGLQEAYAGLADIQREETLDEAYERFSERIKEIDESDGRAENYDVDDEKLSMDTFFNAKADIPDLIRDNVPETDHPEVFIGEEPDADSLFGDMNDDMTDLTDEIIRHEKIIKDAQKTMAGGSVKLKKLADNDMKDELAAELNEQIECRRKLLIEMLRNKDPEKGDKSRTAETIKDLSAGMITAKTYLSKLKKGKLDLGEMSEKGFDFDSEVKNLKESKKFRSFAEPSGKNTWENAKALGEKALSKGGSDLFAGFAAHKPKAKPDGIKDKKGDKKLISNNKGKSNKPQA